MFGTSISQSFTSGCCFFSSFFSTLCLKSVITPISEIIYKQSHRLTEILFHREIVKCLTETAGYDFDDEAVQEGGGGLAERPVQRTRPLVLSAFGFAPGSCCCMVHALFAVTEATGEAGISELVGFAQRFHCNNSTGPS